MDTGDDDNDNEMIQKKSKEKLDSLKEPKGSSLSKVNLSPEDRALQERLETYVGLLNDPDPAIAQDALNKLKEEIRSATSSMTSVPKPLKFLKPVFPDIKAIFGTIRSAERRIDFADLMSVLSMVMDDPETRQCLKYRLESDLSLINGWGGQYVKHLCAEIRMEMTERLEAEGQGKEGQDKLELLIPMEQIMRVVDVLTKFYMSQNSEPDACDLLMEVDSLNLIENLCEEHNHVRLCEYLRSCAPYHPYPEDEDIYRICFNLYFKFKSYYHALRFALKLDDKKMVIQVMKAVQNERLLKRQLAYLIGWHQFGFTEGDLEDDDDDDDADEDGDGNNDDSKGSEEDDESSDDEDDEIPSLDEIISNSQLSEAFHNLARDLDVLEPKEPETDVFKEQLLDDAPTAIVSARKNLSISYVNAFVNAGFGTDKYMTAGSMDANKWLGKNKDKGQMASVASIGAIMLWDENAVNTVDRYFESDQNYIRAGAYLAIGLACSGMRSEAGLGYALLSQPALGEAARPGQSMTNDERIAATFGLGMAYAGQANEEVFEILAQLVSTEENDDLSSIAALSLGLVYVGTCHSDISELILSDLMERDPDSLNESRYLMNALALGLLFLQRQEGVETTMEVVEALTEINPKYCKTLQITLDLCAYAGSGNVLKLQEFLGFIGQHFDSETEGKDDEKKNDGNNANASANANANGPGGARGAGAAANANEDDDDDEKKEVEDYRFFQSIAVIGVSVLAMGEDLGSSMALRMYDHFIQYGSIRVKRTVPLALATLCVSNPKLEVSDVLSKLSHDHDEIVSCNAILALGLISAGTNNARIASMLRSLTSYYSKEANQLFCVRIAQGLTHMGKGLLTIQPYHSDRFLLSKVSLAGVLVVIFACMDLKTTIFSDKHWYLYSLIMAMKPRMLVTLDEEKLEATKTEVRVGQALDVVGQAGRPKKITGFQTHETPVLLGYKDRAELANDDYVPLTPVLEGFAILTKNTDAKKLKRDAKKRAKQKKRDESSEAAAASASN